MSAGDWVIVAILVFSVVGAAAQGFFVEVFSLAGVIVGFLLAAWEYPMVAGWIDFVRPQWAANIAAFFLVFVLVAVLAGVIGRTVSWAVREAGLRWADRVLGGVFGLVRGLLVVIVAVMAMAAFAPTSQLLAGSSMAPYFLVAGRAASWLAPGQVRNQVRNGIEVLHGGKLKPDGAKMSAGSSPAPEKKQDSAGK